MKRSFKVNVINHFVEMNRFFQAELHTDRFISVCKMSVHVDVGDRRFLLQWQKLLERLLVRCLLKTALVV